MYKKIILASTILAATVGVASAAAPAPYVGGSIGVTNNTVNVSNSFVGINNQTFGAYRGVPFSLFAGYGGVMSESYYLAGELTGTFATASISDNNDLKTSYGLGLSVLPGLMLNDNTLAFARVGVVRSHFTDSDVGNRTGGQFGLGLQTSLTQNLDVRGEYDFVAYKSFNVGAGALRTSLAPRADQFTLGLVYKIS